jgi:hypothetical protein
VIIVLKKEERYMREVSQRFWDGMVIRAWKNFDNCTKLKEQCLYEFGDYPDNLPLLRVKNCYGGVRSWVAKELKPLSDILWVLPPNRYIELLDWLEKNKLDCVTNRRAANYAAEGLSARYRAGKKIAHAMYEMKIYKTQGSRMAQVNVVKPVRSRT